LRSYYECNLGPQNTVGSWVNKILAKCIYYIFKHWLHRQALVSEQNISRHLIVDSVKNYLRPLLIKFEMTNIFMIMDHKHQNEGR
jgi:hypothetical protein